LDLSLFSLINGNHTPWADEMMLLASALGRGGFIWIAAALIAAVFPPRRMAAWRVILSVALTFLLVDGVIKPVIERDRPFEVLEDARLIDMRPVTGSFPSGHAASAMAGALSVGRLLPAARVVWWPVAAMIAVSRIYVGAHWPSDVIAGASIGLAMAWFTLGGRVPPVRPRRADTSQPFPML
jgi:membrane-associated phospholipid phosphatase